MLIEKLLSEWRTLSYKPTYEELLQVQAEQQELLDVIENTRILLLAWKKEIS